MVKTLSRNYFVEMRWILPLIVLCGCTETLDEGFSVSVVIELTPASPPLTQAALAVRSAELRSCPQTGWQRLIDELFLVGTAWAHEASSPTRIGDPHVLQLGGASTIGEFRPAPGRYCILAIMLAPADADAEDVGDDATIVGYTLALTTDGRPRVLIGGEQGIELPLAPLVLDAKDKKRDHVVTVTMNTASWLDGVDLATLDSTTSHERLLDNVAASASLSQ